MSHTQELIDISRAIMEKNDVSVDVLRPVDYEIAYGGLEGEDVPVDPAPRWAGSFAP